MWSDTLQIEILALFAEAQRSIDRRRYRAEARALVWHHVINGRRRERYAEHRALGTAWYERQLERHRQHARAYYDSGRSLELQARRNAERRQRRIGERLCAAEGCDRPVAERRSSRGPTPIYCSSACNRREASRRWWRRRRA